MSTQLNWTKVSAGSYIATFATREYTVEKARKGKKWYLCQSLNPLPLEFTTLKAAQEFAQRSNDLYVGSFQALAKSEHNGASTFLAWSVFAFQCEAINWGIRRGVEREIGEYSYELKCWLNDMALACTSCRATYRTRINQSSDIEKSKVMLPGWFNWEHVYKKAHRAIAFESMFDIIEPTPHMADQAELKSLSTESATPENQVLGEIEPLTHDQGKQVRLFKAAKKRWNKDRIEKLSHQISELKALCIVSSVARWYLLCSYLNHILAAVNEALYYLAGSNWYPFKDWEVMAGRLLMYSGGKIKFCNRIERPYFWLFGTIDGLFTGEAIKCIEGWLKSWDAVYQAAPDIVEREWGHN